jgi:hypothetical protein
MPGNDTERVTSGYTISVGTAALGRIGAQYVMRDRKGHRIVLPVSTRPDRLLEVWAAFQRAANRSEAMPAMLAGEMVSSSLRTRGAASAVGDRRMATNLTG